MKRDNKTRCECGGETTYYDGALGYEAMRCTRCGYDWNGQTEASHLRQVAEYRRIKRALTQDLVAALNMFIAEYEGGKDRELRPEMIAARAAIAKAKGEAT
jgi:hypothetical protein